MLIGKRQSRCPKVCVLMAAELMTCAPWCARSVPQAVAGVLGLPAHALPYLQPDVLRKPHGSALFSRGDTQTLCTVTLGPPHTEAAAMSVVRCLPGCERSLHGVHAVTRRHARWAARTCNPSPSSSTTTSRRTV